MRKILVRLFEKFDGKSERGGDDTWFCVHKLKSVGKRHDFARARKGEI